MLPTTRDKSKGCVAKRRPYYVRTGGVKSAFFRLGCHGLLLNRGAHCIVNVFLFCVPSEAAPVTPAPPCISAYKTRAYTFNHTKYMVPGSRVNRTKTYIMKIKYTPSSCERSKIKISSKLIFASCV